MRRTTIKISDELDARLRHEAERRGVTISQVTREALERYFGLDGGRRKLLAAGIGRSDYTDTAARIEEILSEEWTDPRSS